MKLAHILTTIALAATTASAGARLIPTDLNYSVRLGYNIGGTAPIGMPASIRGMNSFYVRPNILLGFDVQKDLTPRWGVLTGLHYETKNMKVDATVKSYRMAMVDGGDRIDGNFTGNVVTQVDESMLTLPVMATWKPAASVTLKCGPYVSYLMTRSFKGEAYDGYLRKGDPTGTMVNIGMDGKAPATYDFSDDMRHWQMGLDLGVDWNIRRRWGVYADVAWGLTGIHKSSFKTIEQTLYPIYGSLGVTYKLK